ncbi:hypothetical protein PRUB_a4366 [Pseudoalteromonas rubra]|uniref:Uncharacterized protein n=1 Tax=Pseudoalteromonas rubra TaxID=43658 RepID=A0A8T0C4T4_9GAMM|nr:hypothetical protein PRUB_a4366 [Pseudoalteromonas rubra]
MKRRKPNAQSGTFIAAMSTLLENLVILTDTGQLTAQITRNLKEIFK